MIQTFSGALIGLFFTIGCINFSNASNHTIKTAKQLTSLSWSGLESQNHYVNHLFTVDNKTDDFLHLLGKALSERNEGFRSLNSSKINSVEAFFEVTNKAFDDNVDSVINLTIVLRATKDAKLENNKVSNKKAIPETSVTTESKPPPAKGQNSKGQNENKPSAFDKLVLETHNKYRKKHGVPMLTYSARISKVSQDWATYLAEHNEFKHRPNGKFGENIYATVSTDPNYKVSGNKPVDAWYSEIKNYTFNQEPSMDVILKTGHFTQLVWKSSKELGIGIAQSKKTRMYYVVCNYNPRGNYIGQFKKNVLPPK